MEIAVPTLNNKHYCSSLALPRAGFKPSDITSTKEVLISKYRLEFQNSALVRTKRRAIFAWLWSFNKSEEDELNKLKNQITALSDQLYRARRLLPKKEADLSARKAALEQYMRQGGTNHGPTWTDSWTPRRSPVQLKEPVPSAKKRSNKKKEPIPDSLVAKLVVPHK